MKAVNKLALVFSLGALASAAAFATTAEQAYIESCRQGPDMPVPVAVVTPRVSPDYAGTTVELEFTVDVTGKPADLCVKSDTDTTLATAVMDAVKQWRFKPAKPNGVPVATRVLLPVKIVDETLAGGPLAMR